MGASDQTQKTLEAYNDVFADIVNVLLFDGKHLMKEDELEAESEFSMYKADGELHEQERDVAKYWRKLNIRIALMGFENQTKYDPDMPLRVISYDGSGYRAQLLKNPSQESNNGNQRFPVITLVLNFGGSRWIKNKSLKERLCIPEEVEPYVSDYKINVFDIAFLPNEKINKFQSDFRVVADYISKTRIDPYYRPTPTEIKHVDAVLKLLAVIKQDKRYETVEMAEWGISERRVKTVCEVIDRIEEKVSAKSEVKGYARALRNRGLSSDEIIKELRQEYHVTEKEAEEVLVV